MHRDNRFFKKNCAIPLHRKMIPLKHICQISRIFFAESSSVIVTASGKIKMLLCKWKNKEKKTNVKALRHISFHSVYLRFSPYFPQDMFLSNTLKEWEKKLEHFFRKKGKTFFTTFPYLYIKSCVRNIPSAFSHFNDLLHLVFQFFPWSGSQAISVIAFV